MSDEDFDIDSIKIDDLLTDPDLLAELQSLGWSDHAHSHSQENVPKISASAAATPMSSPSAPTSQMIELPPELDDNQIQLDESDFNDPELMQMYEQLSGDKSHISTATSSVNAPSSAVVVKESSLQTQPPQSPTAHTSSKADAVASLASTSVSAPVDIASISADDAKARALAAKRAGHTEEALYWFRISKQKSSAAASTSSTVAKSATNKSSKSSVTPAAGVTTIREDPNFSALETALLEASRTSLAAAKELRESDPNQAVIKMREYKRFEQDLATLRVRRTVPGARAPGFRWMVTQKKISLERLELADDELRVIVEGVFEVEALVREHKVKDLWVEILVGSTGKDGDLGSQRTHTVKFDASSKSATWKFQTSFPIIKRTKVNQASLLRKKITFKLVGQKTGLLWSSTADMALTHMSLSDLGPVSEAGGRTALYQITTAEDGAMKKGKAVGGYLQATMQVRKPLSGAETRTVEERSLQLDAWPSLPDTTISTPVAVSSPASRNPQTSPLPSQSPAVGTTIDYVAGLTEREKSDPEAVDFLESNDVLEAEINHVTQQLQSGTLDEDAQFNAKLRMQMLQVKLQTLVMRVQSETLSLEDYLQLLRERVQRDKQLALYLSKTIGDAEAKEVAVRVMRRMKIMQQEIENAESAGEENTEA